MACRCTFSIKPHSWAAERAACERVSILLDGQMPGRASSHSSFPAGPRREINRTVHSTPYTVVSSGGERRFWTLAGLLNKMRTQGDQRSVAING